MITHPPLSSIEVTLIAILFGVWMSNDMSHKTMGEITNSSYNLT